MTAAAGKFAVGTDGSIYGADGKFDGDSVGNVTTAGGVTAATVSFAVGTDGSIYGADGKFDGQCRQRNHSRWRDSSSR